MCFVGLSGRSLGIAVVALLLLVACGGGGGTGSNGTGGGTGATGGASTGGGTKSSVAWTDRFFFADNSFVIGNMVWDGTRFVTHTQVSTDSKIWEATTSTSQNIAWDGSLFVATGSLWFETSSDGRYWSQHLLPATVSATFHAIAKSNTTWVGVGSGGTIVYSTDNGLTWLAAPTVHINTATITNFAPSLQAVTWTGSQFVAGGESGALVTSPNGSVWTVQPSPNSDMVTSIASKNGLVIVSTTPYSGSTSALLTSPDGASFTWTQRANFTADSIIYAGGKWVAVGGGGSITSVDGITWAAGTGTGGDTISTVAYNGTEYVGLGRRNNSSSSTAVFASADGLNWNIREIANKQTAAAISPSGKIVSVGSDRSSRTSVDSINWNLGNLGGVIAGEIFLDVTWSPQLNAFLGLYQAGWNQYMSSSTDGITWTAGVYAPCGGVGAQVFASPTVLINVGSCLATSADNGATWTTQASPFAFAPNGGFWTGTQFVLLGSDKSVATSPDGVTWTVRSTGLPAAMNGGIAAPGKIVLVGNGGVILTSSDNGVTWVTQTSGTYSTLKRVVWTGNKFYAVGNNATLLSSTDGVTWVSETTTFSSWATAWPPKTAPNFNAIVWSPSTKLVTVVGDGGLIATVP